jgi:Ca-activated chloride channel homolog
MKRFGAGSNGPRLNGPAVGVVAAMAVGVFALAAVLALAQAPAPTVTPKPAPSSDPKSGDSKSAGTTNVPPEEVPVFTSDTRLVVVHASVADKNGKLITNLPESAFKVYENNVEQQLKIFRREDVPVSMGIIIDNSGSMRDKSARVAAAALDLVRASNPQDEVFVVNFNDDAYLDQGLTSDVKKLEEALDRFATKGGTAMRDAVSMSIDYVKDKGRKDKKVLVIVTDGADNTSTLGLEDLVRKAQQSEVLVYTIGILGEEEPREARKAKHDLKLLANTTGGLDYYPKDLEEVDRITPEVAHEIRNQYTLAYSPTNPALDGTYRKISVVVNSPGRPTVRTRNGYYATAGSK